MSTIESKLNKLLDTKESIKNAIIAQGQTVSDSDTFASYADKILAIRTGVELPELTNPITEAQVLSGYEFFDQNGEKKTGSIPSIAGNTVIPGIANQTIVPSQHFVTGDIIVAGDADLVAANIVKGKEIFGVTGNAPIPETPTIGISTTGLITATANDLTATKQLTTQAAKTVTPSTSNQTAVAYGVYTTGEVTVAGDTNLVASNIKNGTTIFGVTGTYVPVFA